MSAKIRGWFGAAINASTAIVATAAVIAAGSVVGLQAASAAGTAPPWEPDGNAAPPYGYLTFFNTEGQQVSSGTDLTHLFDYAVASTGADGGSPSAGGANKATMSFANPQFGVLPANWSTSQASQTFNFSTLPDGTPGNIVSEAATNPVVLLGAADANLMTFLQHSTLDQSAGYVDTTQVRLQDSGVCGCGNLGTSTYWAADIAFNQTSSQITVNGTNVPANGWAQLFPFQSATTTALTATPSSPQPAGTPVQLHVAVTPSTAVGSVQFYDGTTALESPVTLASGAATLTDHPAQGSHTYGAVFLPSAGVVSNPNTATAAISAGSKSSNLTYTINAASTSTSTSLTSSPNPSVTGQSVLYSATVTPTPDGGTVAFTDGGTPITGCSTAAVNVSTGVATCTVTAGYLASASPRDIVASYSGDTHFEGSTATGISQVISEAGTQTVVTSSANPVQINLPVTYTATVSALAPGVGTPTGSVVFMDGATTICTGPVTLSAGKATCQETYTSTSGSPHSITAAYGGATNFMGSTSAAVDQGVTAHLTSVAVVSSKSPSVTGEQVTYTATITPTPDGGTVRFSDGGMGIVGCLLVAASSGTATCQQTYTSTSGLPHSIVAAYSGDTNFGNSTSSAITQIVDKALTTTTVLSSKSPSVTGEQVTYTATVAPVAPGAGDPTGTVTFKDGATPVCTGVALTGGSATCDESPSTAAGHSITAVYSGDTNFATSTSTAITQTVGMAATSLNLASSSNPSFAGERVIFTATVVVTAPGSGAPTGIVTFSEGATDICSAVSVSGGKATCAFTFASISGSPFSITAAYGGDANFDASSSSPLSQTVRPAVAPSAPVDLASKAGPGQVTLTWQPPASDGGSPITGYDIYDATTAGGESATPVNPTPVTGTTYTVTGLTNGTTYFFAVHALNALGESVGSLEVSGSPVLAPGYRVTTSSGTVYDFGNVGFKGSPTGMKLNAPIVGMVPTADGGGYWLVGADGGVFTFGDATFHGSLGSTTLAKPIVGMARTPDGGGYWLVGADGGVFTFGDATFRGSLGNEHLNKPIVSIISTPDGHGYWLVGADGGVFTFGDAPFSGSLARTPLARPIVGAVVSPTGVGYWLVAADGGVFTFAGATFHGSLGGKTLSKPIVSMSATPDGDGYTLTGADGGVFTFGDAVYHGSLPGSGISVNNAIAIG